MICEGNKGAQAECFGEELQKCKNTFSKAIFLSYHVDTEDSKSTIVCDQLLQQVDTIF